MEKAWWGVYYNMVNGDENQGRIRRTGRFAIDAARKGGRWVLDKLVNALSDTAVERGVLDGFKLAADPSGLVIGNLTNARTLGWSGALGVNHKYGVIDSHSMLTDTRHGTVYRLVNTTVQEHDGQRITLAQLVDEAGQRTVVTPTHHDRNYSLDVRVLQTIDPQGRATPVAEERTLNVRSINASPAYRATRAVTATAAGIGLYASGLPGLIIWGYTGLRNVYDHVTGRLTPHNYKGESAEDVAAERKRGAWDAGLEFLDPAGKLVTAVYSPDNWSFYHRMRVGVGDETNTYRRWRNGTRLALAAVGATALHYLGLLDTYVVGGLAVTASAISNGYLRGMARRIRGVIAPEQRRQSIFECTETDRELGSLFQDEHEDDLIYEVDDNDGVGIHKDSDEDSDYLIPPRRPAAAQPPSDWQNGRPRRDVLFGWGQRQRANDDERDIPPGLRSTPRGDPLETVVGNGPATPRVQDEEEDQLPETRNSGMSRRLLLGGLLRLGGAGTGIYYGRRLGVVLGDYTKPPIQAAEDTYLTLKAIGKAFGMGDLFGNEYDAIREIPEELNKREKSGQVLTALETKIRDTYTAVVRSHDTLKEQTTFTDKVKEAVRTGQIGIGRVGEKGVELKRKLNSKTIETIDRTIIDFYNKLGLLPDTSDEQGADAYEKFRNRDIAIRKFEEALASIQKIRSNYQDLIKYLHGEYIVNPDKPAEEKKGALDLMATVAQEHYQVALKVKDLVQEGHTKLPDYQSEITQMNDLHSRILGVAKAEYGFEPESAWVEKWRTFTKWAGGIVGAGVGYLLGAGISKGVNALSGRPEVYDVPQRRLTIPQQTPGNDGPNRNA